MEYFCEIKLAKMPYAVYRATVNTLLSKIHGTLNTLGVSDIGLSMPGYYKGSEPESSQLGDRFHLVCKDKERLMDVVNSIDLEDLMMLNMVSLSRAKEVPVNTPRAIFKRRRVEERYHARKRQGWKSPNYDGTYPFFRYRRPGRKKDFVITIERVENDVMEGEFNSYGLSSTHSVPIIRES